jgi:hypothetical protein
MSSTPGAHRSPCSVENGPHSGGCPGTCSLWDTRIRWIFLTFCAAAGAIVAYTTRYFVNGDAVAYFDMADAFGRQRWVDLLNLHYSPGYAMLLGLVNKCAGTWFPNELFAAKAVNFFCYILALLALEVLLHQIKTDDEFSPSLGRQHIGWIYFRAAAYGLFLLSSLVYIRIQVVSPDMLEFCFTLLVAAVLVWIKKSDESFTRFVLLGLVTGLGYLCKTPFFPMSVVFLVLSAFYSTSLRRALPRVLVAGIVFLIVGSLLYVPMSSRLGRLSFGESGNYNYAHFVAGRGCPAHLPERVWTKPEVDVYSGGSLAATYPVGFDLSYWNEGVKPSFDFQAQSRVFAENLVALVDLNPWLHVFFLVWVCLQARMGASFSVKLRPPVLAVLFGTISAAGVVLFCLVLVEARYVAPYVFLGLTAILLWPWYGLNHRTIPKVVSVGVILITAFSITVAVMSVWDQTSRSLYDTGSKQSYRKTYLENLAVKDFLHGRGVSRGSLAAILGQPSLGIYWARLTGLRAIATISDPQAFFAVSSEDRAGAINALRSRHFRVILGTGDYRAQLRQEGWCRIPGTTDCFVLFLE